MRAKQTARLAFTISVGLALLGCGSSFDEQFGGKTWASKHFRYRFQPEDPMACRGVLDRLETYAGVLRTSLGIDERLQGMTTYYKYRSASELEQSGACSERAQACASSSEIFSSQPLDGHELIHNVMAKETGTSVSRLLAEGLANALSCEPGTMASSPDWSYSEFARPPSSTDVVQAGWLVLGLLRHTSAPEVVEMIAAIDDEATPAETRQRLLDGWGLDLDVIQSEAAAAGLEACVPVFACSGPALEEGQTTLGVGCDGFDPATLPGSAGPLSLRVTGSPMRLMPCDLGTPEGPLARVSPYRALGQWEYWFQSPASPHALWFDEAERAVAPREAQITLARAANTFMKDCDLGSARTIELGQQLAIVLTGAEGVVYFPLSLDQALALRLGWQMGGDYETNRFPTQPIEVSWCEGCTAGSATDCQLLDRLVVEPQSVTTTGQGILRIEPSAPLARTAVLEVGPTVP